MAYQYIQLSPDILNFLQQLKKAISLFQLKGHGLHGVIGVHAQGLVIPTLVFAQCFTMVTCHALEPQVKLETVKVRRHVWFVS